MHTPEEILKKHSLRKTHLRAELIRLLQGSGHAVSQPELERTLGDISDRVTLYRALKSFEENGIVHRVFDNNGTARYALCDECHSHRHEDRHVHFNCEKCEHVFCLEGVDVPSFSLPPGYEVHDVQLVVKGICNQCLHKP